MSDEEIKKMIERGFQQINNKMDEFEKRISDIEDKIEPNEVKTSEKTLDKYPADVKREFLSKVKDAGSEGLKKHDIMEIFGVGKTQAYNIQQNLNADYEWCEYKAPEGKAGLTRHKIHAYAEEIANANGVDKKKVINEAEKSITEDKGKLDILETEYDKLQEEEKNKKTKRPGKSNSRARRGFL